jgi:hypothetical protein
MLIRITGREGARLAPAYVTAHEQRPIGLAQGAEAVGNTGKGADHAARLEAPSSQDESTFCLQCWRRHIGGPIADPKFNTSLLILITNG